MAVTSAVLLAWTTAAVVSFYDAPRTKGASLAYIDPDVGWPWGVRHFMGGEEVAITTMAARFSGNLAYSRERHEELLKRCLERGYPHRHPPQWIRHKGPAVMALPDSREIIRFWEEEAYGVPFLCLARSYEQRDAAPGVWQDVWQIAVCGTPRLVPLRPLWIGTCGNVATYLLAAITVWIGSQRLKRWRRRRRNWCVVCGYVLDGLAQSDGVCPECGTPVPAGKSD